MKKFFGLLTAIILLAACSTSLTLQEQDTGSSHSVATGEKAVISLPENPTTGYSWQFFITPENQDVIANTTQSYIAPDSHLMGAGGIKEYSFTAMKKGTVTITGYYYRSWEKLNPKRDRKVVYTVSVSD